MDPLEVPLLSKYEWEYKNDINQRMRVPDKLSVSASMSEPTLSENKQKGVAYPENRIIQPERTPGFSPDLLTNEDINGKPSSSVTVTANASASAVVHIQGDAVQKPQQQHQQHQQQQGGVDLAVEERMRVTVTRITNIETHVSRLSSRLRSLEQQQTVIGGIITIYFGLKIIRFILSPLLG